MLQKIAPILSAINISETNLFYRNKLKFQTVYYGNYLIVRKENIEIHYIESIDPLHFTPASCCIFADNIEDLFTKFSCMDLIRPIGNLQTNTRGKKDFFIVDNNNNKLIFCEL